MYSLFTCSLVNGAAIISDCLPFNARFIGEERIGKDAEGSGRDLI
jgi:hypothetical protein